MRPIIYHPSGRAGEYAKKGYAVNLFRGCTHSCRYCFSPSVMRMSRKDFHSVVATAPDALERLKKDMAKVGVLAESIFLCFTCDPYCEGAPRDITREAIKIILESGNTVNLLTKGGMKACKDFDLLVMNPGNKIGATLTFSLVQHSRYWEPRAEDPLNRLVMLEKAKDRGIQTWASIEPVIEPQQTLQIMAWAMPYVDKFKIGKWNHDKRAKLIDWKRFRRDVEALLEGKDYYLKQDLLDIT